MVNLTRDYDEDGNAATHGVGSITCASVWVQQVTQYLSVSEDLEPLAGLVPRVTMRG